MNEVSKFYIHLPDINSLLMALALMQDNFPSGEVVAAEKYGNGVRVLLQIVVYSQSLANELDRWGAKSQE